MKSNFVRGFVQAWFIVGLAALLLTGCGSRQSDREREMNLKLNQQLSALNEKIAQLDKQLADLRVETDQRLNLAVASSKQISAQIAQINSELVQRMELPLAKAKGQARPPVVLQEVPSEEIPLPASPRVETPRAVPEQTEGETAHVARFWFRLILILIIVAAVYFIVKIYLSRWSDDEDEDMDEDIGEEEEPGAESPDDKAARARDEPPGEAPPEKDDPKSWGGQ
ncbi:MAG: hypothetical protein M1457_07875 [bacterium]|nr:hypothetical protein [bacterium]